MCPGGSNRQRSPVAFPAKPLQPPVTCFRRKRACSTITANELPVAMAFAMPPAAKLVQDSHLIPLFSRNKDACPGCSANRVAHLPQKPELYSVHMSAAWFPLGQCQYIAQYRELSTGFLQPPAMRYQGSCQQIRSRNGTAAEHRTPLNTDSTTVSSSVYRIITGRVVSSLVAPAGAIQQK